MIGHTADVLFDTPKDVGGTACHKKSRQSDLLKCPQPYALRDHSRKSLTKTPQMFLA
ncbi:hypothetical protein U14_00592 [Candidatus Moduliflexus flocculans]|uniref:Uncharacterized protein n=1 Tax=Candidatus Moduliflexus flocculans TaxID=1499966 RepID=A0A0S6VQD5_9BACT|nr:hypothetical protein U14_00592 [Candidatus Moduliflexus flocculans]